jgi:hypothetical protein
VLYPTHAAGNSAPTLSLMMIDATGTLMANLKVSMQRDQANEIFNS